MYESYGSDGFSFVWGKAWSCTDIWYWLPFFVTVSLHCLVLSVSWATFTSKLVVIIPHDNVNAISKHGFSCHIWVFWNWNAIFALPFQSVTPENALYIINYNNWARSFNLFCEMHVKKDKRFAMSITRCVRRRLCAGLLNTLNSLRPNDAYMRR